MHRKFIKKFVLRLFFSTILVLICLISVKKYPQAKSFLQKEVYEKNINFSAIDNVYKKYFGSSLPFKDFFEKEKAVFQEKIEYEEESKYLDGVSLSVTDPYLVPILETGMVIFIGEKEGYGKTVILEGTDGVEIWYGNLSEVNVELYDLKEKGEYLGSAKGNLYLVFKKDGKVLDYKNYLS